MSAPPKMPLQDVYAFPLTVSIPDGAGGTYYSNCPGMTLRDYFAAAAVSDAMRAVAAQQIQVEPGEQPQDAVARVAYNVEDAMLKRRGT